jgi:regulator of replication initiation timing
LVLNEEQAVHILTKVFVVLAAVMSLMLAAATMIYAHNAESVRHAYEKAELASVVSNRALSTQAETHSRESATLMGEIQAMNQELASARADLDSLKIEAERLRREKFAAEAEAERSRGQISQFGVASQTQATLIEQYKDEVGQLRDAELRFRGVRLDLEDAIADQTSQIEVLQQENRALQEQLVAARSDLEAAQTGGATARAGGGGASGPVQLAGAPIFGTVRAVQTEEATGKRLVQVDLGANDRMRENVKLLVFRGTTFIANVVLKSVDLQDSLGEVVLLADGMQVQSGDRVTTRLVP